MRATVLPLLVLVACDTPGSFGSAIFGGDDDDGIDEAAMIAQLEAEPVATPPQRVQATVPPLPSTTWIQVFDRSARIAHRIHADGRYTVKVGDGAEQEMPVISQAEPQARTLSAEALARIESALQAVHFDQIAPHVPEEPIDPAQGVAVIQRRPLAITVRDAQTGGVHTVQVGADDQLPATFGPLAPLWRVLDHEVFGRWLEAAVARAPDASTTAAASAP